MEQIELNQVPEEVFGVKLDELTRDRLAQGLETNLIEGFVFDDGEVRNAKLKMTQDEDGNAHLGFRVQKEELNIPQQIGDYFLTAEDRQDLLAGKTKLVDIHGTEAFLQIDKELNSVVVKSANELDIREVVALKHEKGTLRIGDNYQPTSDEVKQLMDGKQLDAKVFRRDGVYFAAKVSLTDDFKGIKFSDILEIKNLEKALELERKLNNPSAKLEESVVKSGVDIMGDYVYRVDEVQDINQKVENKEELKIDNDYAKNLEKEVNIGATTEEVKNEILETAQNVTQNISEEIKTEQFVDDKAVEHDPKNVVETTTRDVSSEVIAENVKVADKAVDSSPKVEPLALSGQDKDFIKAVGEKDYDKLLDMKSSGYTPSEKVMDDIKNNKEIGDDGKTAVKAMFNIEDKKEQPLSKSKQGVTKGIDRVDTVKSKDKANSKSVEKKGKSGEKTASSVKEIMNAFGRDC